ncbi:hypothetical protein [Actinospica sp.]|uniref:hypothetical protein n=1 Tax=Actinospica sp. TaxID=1872142 RepID=UPI002B5D21F0|nr:hypothetical protein [Actinospica sp.]HWG23949.1 hypothetical protein [Actinospica sp.]
MAFSNFKSDLRKRFIAGAMLVAALFTLIQAVDYRQNVPSNDTYQYAKQTLRILGDSQDKAIHDAVVMYCQDSGNAAATASTLNYAGGSSSSSTSYSSAYNACLSTYRNGLTPNSARYLAIFTSRPGYPLLAAPFAALFGLRFGLWFAAMLCTIIGGLLVIVLLRTAGAARMAALGGQVLFLAAPTGYWGSRMLTDGPSLATTLLALLGALSLAKGRTRAGLWALGAGLVTGFVVRYSSEQIAALVLAVAALICLRWVPSSRTRGMKLLAAVAGGGFIVSEIASTALGWPGLSASLQDTFTKHFIRPDVSDPVGRLVKLDLHYWGYYPVSEPTALLLLVGLIAIAVALVRRDAVYGIFVIAVAATGLAAVIAHPISSQADRLMSPVWVLLALGLPLLFTARRDPVPEPHKETAFASEAA